MCRRECPRRSRERLGSSHIVFSMLSVWTIPVIRLNSFFSQYNKELPTTCKTLARHIGECLIFYLFPECHWKHIRTCNVIERTFKELKKRIKGISHFSNEISPLVMVFSIPINERLK